MQHISAAYRTYRSRSEVPQKHKLRAVRDNDGRTQKQLAADSGISASTISHIECHRGPDVPLSEWRPTRTRAHTIIALVVELGCIPVGEYSVEELIVRAKKRDIPFSANEISEAVRRGLVPPSRRGELRRQPVRSTTRTPARRGHLRAVA